MGQAIASRVRLAGITPLLVALQLGLTLANASPTADRPFEIQVVDEATGRGVPLVELRTVNEIRLVTDSAGRVAFDEPGLMGRSVFFHVASHGYSYPADGFGIRGKALDVEPGGRAELRIKRLNIAERLYRVTGQGIYRDTTVLGHNAPIRRAQPQRPGARARQRAQRRVPGPALTGSGATPTARPTRWATSTRRAPSPTCPAMVGSTPTLE